MQFFADRAETDQRESMSALSEGLSDFIEATAGKSGIPGVAVGVWADGQEIYACHGVTSVDNPLPVDRDTLYVLGSVTKTYTATTLMRLVAEGRPLAAEFPALRPARDLTQRSSLALSTTHIS